MPENNDLPKPETEKLEIKAEAKKPSVMGDIGRYVMEEYLVPQATDMMHDLLAKLGSGVNDAFQGALNKFFYKEDRGRTYRGSSTSSHTSYTTYYSTPSSASATYASKDTIARRSSNEVKVIVVDREEDAKRLVSFMQGLIRNYHVAKVSDLYSSLTPKIPIAFTDYKYGWTNPNEIGYHPIFSGPDRGKYQLDLPMPIDISNVQ